MPKKPKKSKGQKIAARKKAKQDAAAQAAKEAVWGTGQVDLTGSPTPPKPPTVHLPSASPTVKEALKFVNPKAAKKRAKKRAKKEKKRKKEKLRTAGTEEYKRQPPAPSPRGWGRAVKIRSSSQMT